MATLARPKIAQHIQDPSLTLLQTSVPTPFPSNEERLQEEILEELANEKVDFEINVESPKRLQSSSYNGLEHEVMPSIVYVQKSCLMTLNNLLSGQAKWNPIVPERRHSMPSSSLPATMPLPDISALQTLLSNVRNRNSEGEAIEVDPSLNNTELIDELRSRVDALVSSLAPSDAQLARALVSLLSHFNRLSVIQSNTLSYIDTRAGLGSLTEQPVPSADVFDVLKRQLSDLQVERKSKGDGVAPGSPPILAVEIALLWNTIDEELEMVLSLCKERTENLPRLSVEHQPPQYDLADYEYEDIPPEYEYGGVRSSLESSSDTKPRYSMQSTISSPTEKMRLDLEAVTMAIDRLYMVAPQLHNQRVELKTSKVEEMEKARRAGTRPKSAVSEGKQRERDVKELEGILDLIGKASDRKMTDQSVILDGGMKARLEKARQRDIAKRDAFVEQLANHSDAGRLHSQDAVLQPAKVKDLDTPMTLPEFLRESMAEAQQKESDSEALLSLPEFFKEPVPDHVLAKPPSIGRIKKKSRSRSLSAPSLSWLRPSSSRSSGLGSAAWKPRSRPGSSTGSGSTPSSSLSVHYVAEHHENLNHVLVFLTIPDLPCSVDVQAEVVRSFANSEEGEHFVIHYGSCTSAELDLPVPILPGDIDVKIQRGHFELKLSTPSTNVPLNPTSDPIPLLDASQLSISNPTGFVCSSCSLPLVQSAKISSYRDLPSEHWEELVDAWMCHTDQHLHEHVARHGRGFWPDAGQALIGGSYILFEESSVVKTNLFPSEQPKREDWRLVRCICGAVAGRCQNHQIEAGVSATVYRLVKYAIRPVTPMSDPARVPLSAFIVEDMMEFVHAHATYRFVISDEEEERPRLLIWLFKPNLRIAYTTPKQYVLPKSGSIHAAKVLFKVLGPSTVSTDMKAILNKYPGFPQAEYLFYPVDICGRLTRLLKESNTSYPESMRTMTGLDVGWLHRA